MQSLVLSLVFLAQTPATQTPTTPPAATQPPQTPAATTPPATSNKEILGTFERVWLRSQQCYADGWKIIGNSPYVGLYRVYRKYPGDPYGFIAIFNQTRAMYGLPPVIYDPDLSSWAAANNAEQAKRGMGHHIVKGSQNAAQGQRDAAQVTKEWMNSPGHRVTMLLAGTGLRAGIAFGPGNYWTLNVVRPLR